MGPQASIDKTPPPPPVATPFPAFLEAQEEQHFMKINWPPAGQFRVLEVKLDFSSIFRLISLLSGFCVFLWQINGLSARQRKLLSMTGSAQGKEVRVSGAQTQGKLQCEWHARQGLCPPTAVCPAIVPWVSCLNETVWVNATGKSNLPVVTTAGSMTQHSHSCPRASPLDAGSS